MPVRVARGLKSRIREDPGGIVVQVQGASDADVAAEALRRAAAEVAALDGGWRSAPGLSPGDTNGPTYVSGVTQTPLGPFISVDGGYTPRSLLATIPEIVVRHLEEAGLTEAVVGWPRARSAIYRSNHMGLYGIGPAALLHLFPPPLPIVDLPRPWVKLPMAWAGVAASWLTEGLQPDDEVWADIGGVSFPLAAADVAGFVENCRARRRPTQMTAGGPDRFRAVHARFSLDEWLVLGGGGRAVSRPDLRATFDVLATVGRVLAPEVGYACASADPTFTRIGAVSYAEWEPVSRPGPGTFQSLCDEIVPDAFPWQILGPGHVARLAAGGRSDLPGATPLPGGRVELAIGELDEWLPGRPTRRAAREGARRLLAPCILGHQEASDLLYAKLQANRAAGLS